MKNKKPETIADLKINWCFSEKLIQYKRFYLLFSYYNQNLRNYLIKNDKYIFQIIIDDDPYNYYKFEIICKDYDLWKLMWKIHTKIAEKLNNEKIEMNKLHLCKFKTTLFINAFIIEYDLELPF